MCWCMTTLDQTVATNRSTVAVNPAAVFENIMDRKNYQRGSNEKDGDRQRNSETIQDQEIAISRTSYTT